jgi:hypothetical protein
VIFNDEPRNPNPRLPIVKSLKDPAAAPRKTPDEPAPVPAKPANPNPKPVKQIVPSLADNTTVTPPHDSVGRNP